MDSVQLSSEPDAHFVFKFAQASGRELRYELVEPLARETDYRFAVEAKASSDALLDPPYTFSFTTGIEPRPEPELPPEIRLSPSDAATGVELTPKLSFSFSKRMDQTSVESALHFQPDAQCGELTWNDEGSALDCVIAGGLPPATTITVTLDATASAADGSHLDEPWTSTFTTRARPALVSTSPEDGRVVADLSGSVVLVFEANTSMDEASLETAFRYVTPAGHPIMEASCFFERCTLTTSEPFDERQVVTWQLSADAVDTSGVALGEAASGTFTTGHRASVVLSAIPALDGTVTEAGAVDASGAELTVGRSGGAATRGLLSFDLAQLPGSLLAFSKATLTLNHVGTNGSTSGFGFLLVSSVDYGSSLTATAFDAPPHGYETCNLLWQCTNETFDAGFSASGGSLWTAPVSRLVQRDIDEKAARSQMRLAFKSDTMAGSNGSEVFSSANAAAASRPSLQIEYWEP